METKPVRNNDQSMKQKNNTSDSKSSPIGVAYLMGRTHQALTRRMRNALASIGLSVAQYTALSFLVRGSLSNAQLAERAMISPQAANEMVKTMSARGWITREPDSSHGRIIRIGLTEEGEAVLNSGHACVAEIEAAMLAGLRPAQGQALKDDLRAMLRNLSEPEL